MDFKQAKIDGSDVLKDSSSGIYYVSREWRRLSTSDDSRIVDGWHGRTVSPTYARVRTIVLEGFVERLDNPNESAAVEYLENLFALQGTLTAVIPKTLYVKDAYDREWTMPVKVKDPIEFANGDDDFRSTYWKWRVALESVEDPVYRSLDEILASGTEGTFGGVELGTELGVAFDGYVNLIECVTAGNFAAPARFEITCVDSGESWSAAQSPITVRNVTDGTSFAIDVGLVVGDVLVIDAQKLRCYKNGVDVTTSRIPGSVFPSVVRTTQFSVTDADGGLPSNDFSVGVYFRDALI